MNSTSSFNNFVSQHDSQNSLILREATKKETDEDMAQIAQITQSDFPILKQKKQKSVPKNNDLKNISIDNMLLHSNQFGRKKLSVTNQIESGVQGSIRRTAHINDGFGWLGRIRGSYDNLKAHNSAIDQDNDQKTQEGFISDQVNGFSQIDVSRLDYEDDQISQNYPQYGLQANKDISSNVKLSKMKEKSSAIESMISNDSFAGHEEVNKSSIQLRESDLHSTSFNATTNKNIGLKKNTFNKTIKFLKTKIIGMRSEDLSNFKQSSSVQAVTPEQKQ